MSRTYHCECGKPVSIGDDFFYFYKCPACHKKYFAGRYAGLTPLTDEQIDDVMVDLNNSELLACHGGMSLRRTNEEAV